MLINDNFLMCLDFKIPHKQLGRAAHTDNISTQQAEAGGLGVKLVLMTWRDPVPNNKNPIKPSLSNLFKLNRTLEQLTK